jgi:hypothetical protein
MKRPSECAKLRIGILILSSVACAASACSGGGKGGGGGAGGAGQNPPPAITTLVPSGAVVNTGPITVTINGQDFNLAHSLTIIFGPGTVSPTLAQSTSTSLVVTVPNSDLQTVGNDGVQVLDNTSGKSSTVVSFKVTQVPPAALALVPAALPDATVNVAYNKAIFATGGVPPYSFTVTGLPANSLQATLLPSSLVISGTPGTVQAGLKVTVSVKDSSNSTAGPQSYSLNVDATPAAACPLVGQYAFFLTGSDSNGAAAMAGSITVAADGSVSGVFDFKDPSQLSAAQSITGAAGSCGSGAYPNMGALTFSAGGTQRTFAFAMDPDDDSGFLSETDATGTQASGRIELQIPASFQDFHGSYGFGMAGSDAGGNRYGVAGAFCSNSSFQLTSLQADLQDNGTDTQAASGTGTYLAPDANGRSTTTSPFTFPGGMTLDLTLYVVNGGEAFALESSPTSAQSPSAVLAGSITGLPGPGCLPTAQGGNFPLLVGTGVAFWEQGGQGASAISALGVIGFGGNNQATVSGFFSPGASLINAPATYSFTASGRGTVSFIDSNNVPREYVLYFDGLNAAYFIGLSAAVELGRAEPMTGLPANQTVQSIGGPYAYGSQFVYSGATAPPPAQLTFDNSPSPPTVAVAGGPSGTYNLIGSGGMWQGQIGFSSSWLGTQGMVYLAVSPTKLMFIGSTSPYANVIGFLVQEGPGT